ncbi:hypothetical protein ACQY0O_005275 [Thecaphora frezii]
MNSMNATDSPESSGQPGHFAASPSVKPSPEPARVRSSRACTHCSHRKAKCDGNHPCSSCVRGEHECIYTTPKKRGPPKGAPARGGVRKKRIATSSDAPTLPAPLPATAHEAHAFGFGSRSVEPDRSVAQVARLGQTFQLPTPPGQGQPQPSYHAQAYDDSGRLPTVEAVLAYPPRDDISPRAHREEPDTGVGLYTSSSRHRDGTGWDAFVRDHSARYVPPAATLDNPGHRHAPTEAQQSFRTREQAYAHTGWRRSTGGHGTAGKAFELSEVAREDGPKLMSFPKIANDLPALDREPRTQYQEVSQPSSRAPNTEMHNILHQPITNGAHLHARYSSSTCSSSGLIGGGPVSIGPAPSPPAIARGSSPQSSWTSAAQRGSFSSRATSHAHTNSVPSAGAPYFYHRQYSGSAAATSYERGAGTASTSPNKRETPALVTDRLHDELPGTSFWTSAPGVLPPMLSPASDDHINRRATSREGLLGIPLRQQAAEDLLPAKVITRLLDIYQAFIHPHWPIIYLPSIASLQSLRTTKPVLFEAILAVSSTTFDNNADTSPDPVPESELESLLGSQAEASSVKQSWKSGELSRHFVDRVKTRILDGNFERSIATIQAAILISVVEMGCGHNSSSWQFSGIACRMALDMNLHRLSSRNEHGGTSSDNARRLARGTSHQSATSASNRDGPNNAELQEQKRVLWACFILDKILCTVLEKPVQLRTADIETNVPSVYERDEYELWLNDTTQPFVSEKWLPVMEGVKVHAMSSFQSWAQVMGILERILDDVYSPRAKYERRRTNGESDRAVLIRLNEALAGWRRALPPHLQWSDPPTSAEPCASNAAAGDRPGTLPHRGVGPHVLTVRGWYCICVILLHRPRVPQLLKPGRSGWDASARMPRGDASIIEGPRASASTPARRHTEMSHSFTSVPLQPQMQNLVSPLSPSFQGEATGERVERTAVAQQQYTSTDTGLGICNSAAREVCDILEVYDTTFLIRKISSSWVYLIFQSATIHSALAPAQAMRAHRRHRSRLARRKREEEAATAHFQSFHHAAPRNEEPNEDDYESIDEGPEWAAGSRELISEKESERYLSQCLEFLSRIGPTWKIANHHVTTLEKLCIASAKTRPSSPLRIVKSEEEDLDTTTSGAAAATKAVPDRGTPPAALLLHGQGAPRLIEDTNAGEDQLPSREAGGMLYALAQEAARCHDSSAEEQPPTTTFGQPDCGPSIASVGPADGSTTLSAPQSGITPVPPIQGSGIPSTQLQAEPAISWTNFWNNMPVSSVDEVVWANFFSSQPPQAPWAEQSGTAIDQMGTTALDLMPRGGGVGLASSAPYLSDLLRGDSLDVGQMQGI